MKKEYQKNESVRKFLSDPSLYAFVLLFCYALVIYPGCTLILKPLSRNPFTPPSPPPNGCTGRYYHLNSNSYFDIHTLTRPLRYEWSGDTPPGLSFDENTGIISGVPTETGVFRIEITVHDSAAHPSDYRPPSEIFVIGISDFEIVTPGVLPVTCVDEMYSTPIEICGGRPYFEWEISGWLPEDQPLSFREERTTARVNRIQGTPLKDDYTYYTFTVTVEDRRNGIIRLGNLLEVTDDLTILSPQTLPTGTVDDPYNYPLQACGGDPSSYVWSLHEGDLPPGLELRDSNIRGIPIDDGVYGFRLKLTDGPTEQYRSFNIIINDPFRIHPIWPPLHECLEITEDIRDDYCIRTEGGMGEKVWEVVDESELPPGDESELPPGVGLDEEGCFTGRPTTPGTYPFLVRVTDATTGPDSPREGPVIATVNPYPANSASLDFERIRQWAVVPEEPPPEGYLPPDNINVDSGEIVKVDFTFTDPTWVSDWDRKEDSPCTNLTRQVRLYVVGLCNDSGIETTWINPLDRDDPCPDECNCRFIDPENTGYDASYVCQPYDIDDDGDKEHVARFVISDNPNEFDDLIMRAIEAGLTSPFNFRISVSYTCDKGGTFYRGHELSRIREGIVVEGIEVD